MAISSSTLGFGGFKIQENGRMTLSPKVQGIDFLEIVDSLVEVKMLTTLSDKEEISKLSKELSAINELQTYTEALQNTAQALRNPLTFAGATNIFQQKVVSAQSNSATSASQILSAVATQSARTGTYSIEVTRIARSDTLSSSVGESLDTTPIAGVAAGTLTINGQNISISATPTLQELKTAINNLSDDTGVVANVIKVTNTDYRLNLVASETGTPITLSDSSAGALLTSLHLATSGETTTSLSAEIIYNNLPIQRSSNTISDLIPGMTIDLINAAPGTTVQLSVENDAIGIKSAIQEFVTAYNTLNAFVNSQREFDATTGKVDYDKSPLFNNVVLRSVAQSALASVANNALGVNFNQIANLTAIGITLTKDNSLVIDDDTLNDALISDLTSVRKLFGFDFDQSNYSIGVSATPDTLSSSLINSTTGESLPITVTFSLALDGVTYSATISDGTTTVAATLDSHNNIIAPDGTIFSGFEFTYDGLTLTAGTSATTVFTPSQGIADQLYQNLTIHTQAFTGSFVSETNFLNDRKETSQKHIDEVTARAERERARLTQVYSKLAALYAQMENDVMQIQMFSESFYRK